MLDLHLNIVNMRSKKGRYIPGSVNANYPYSCSWIFSLRLLSYKAILYDGSLLNLIILR